MQDLFLLSLACLFTASIACAAWITESREPYRTEAKRNAVAFFAGGVASAVVAGVLWIV